MVSLPPIENCWFLTGPTASGKTRVGLELAERLGAEIISLDSMAIYRGMDVGTAKPTPAERARVRHHMIDIVDPDCSYSMSEYVRASHRAAAEIRDRGREVLFVGGTPLYLKSMLYGVSPGPPADREFRRQVEAELQEVGIEGLHQRLRQVDPLSAAKLHPHDKRRIIRALEVYKLTGQPISHAQTQFEDRPAQTSAVYVLHRPRAELHRRIEARVERMFAAGFVEEVSGLLANFEDLSDTALQAVGYREVIAHLRGETSRAETVERVKARTRQFARRQETWFRSLPECRPVHVDPDASAAEIAARIAGQGSA